MYDEIRLYLTFRDQSPLREQDFEFKFELWVEKEHVDRVIRMLTSGPSKIDIEDRKTVYIRSET